MKIRLLLFSILFSATSLPAQFVAFSNSNSLLGSVSGFTYADCVVDMNGDGLDDVVRVTNNAIFIDYQKEGGGFEQQSFPMSFTNLPSWSIAAGDLDGNGYNDLLFGDGNAVSFVLANADGTGYAEHAMPEYIFSQRSTFADIDNDGDLDAFVCHDVDQSHPYRNDGNGNMVEDQSLIETIDLPGNYAAIWTDYDNDGDIDLYITKCRGGAQPGDPARTNGLYRNNGDGTFTGVGAEAGVDDNAQSWSTVFEDFDNDGDFDAFIVNHDFQNRFYLNNGDGTFTDIIDQTGINPNDLGAWENAAGDFNNDGFVDIYSELTKELYLNNGDLTFTGQDLPASPGAIGDVNNDGFLDVMAWGNLYTNNGNDNNWLKINTIGIVSNKNGIGARVEIHGDWGTQIREVRSGQSFAPMSSMQIHFGIGQSTAIDSVVVKWPSGKVTKVENPTINTTLELPEAECLLPDSDLVVNGETTLCPGESVELSAPAGFNEFIWSNGETNQSIIVDGAGAFSAILYNADECVSFTNTVSVELVEESAPTIEVEGNDVFCQGSEVILTATGADEYLWSNDETSESIVISESGEFTVSATGFCSGETLVSEPVNVAMIPAPAPLTETDIIVANGEPAFLNADGQGGEVKWYDAPTGGSLLGTGSDFETPIISGQHYFYPQSVHHYPGENQTGGKLDFSGSGGHTTQGTFNLFDVWEPFTLNSVLVQLTSAGVPGTRTIQLVNANQLVLAEKVFDLSIGQHVLELDFEVPVGNDLSLRCVEGDLFRNDNNVNYPYPIGDVGEMTTSFVFGDQYYYYFYDWKITVGERDCVSERVEVFVQGVNSTSEELAAAGVDIFPNPAYSELFVKIENPASFLRLLDVSGKEILRKEISGNETVELDVTDFAAGIYTVQMEVDGKILSSRVLVQSR